MINTRFFHQYYPLYISPSFLTIYVSMPLTTTQLSVKSITTNELDAIMVTIDGVIILHICKTSDFIWDES